MLTLLPCHRKSLVLTSTSTTSCANPWLNFRYPLHLPCQLDGSFSCVQEPPPRIRDRLSQLRANTCSAHSYAARKNRKTANASFARHRGIVRKPAVQWFRQNALTNLSILLTWGSIVSAADSALKSYASPTSSPWRGQLTAGLGRYVTFEDPKTSLLLRGALQRHFGRDRIATGEIAVERPFSAYDDWKVPRLAISLTQSVDEHFLAGVAVSALGIDRWSIDGALFRAQLFAEGITEPWRWLTLRLRVGPVGYLARYRQRADGTEIPIAGIDERASATAKLGPLLLDLFVSLEQAAVHGGWHNEYGIGERLAVRVAPGFLLGAAHELWTGLVDAGTGVARPVRLADERESRVTTFLEWVF
jgi:hypothetical protein